MTNRPAHLRRAAAAVLMLATMLALCARADDKPATTPAQEVDDEAFDAALDKAAAAKVGEAEFRAALRSVAARFPLVEASTEAGKGEWRKVALNVRGKRVDAIRVRTPAGERRDLVWAFTAPKSLDQWYILAMDGDMKQGFRDFWTVKPPEMFGPDVPASAATGVVQTLEASSLEPGREYLLWFAFKNDQPADAWVTVSFLPSGKSGSAETAMEGLGVPRPASEAAASGR